MGWLPDETGPRKCAANHVALTPLSHLNSDRMAGDATHSESGWIMDSTAQDFVTSLFVALEL